MEMIKNFIDKLFDLLLSLKFVCWTTLSLITIKLLLIPTLSWWVVMAPYWISGVACAVVMALWISFTRWEENWKRALVELGVLSFFGFIFSGILYVAFTTTAKDYLYQKKEQEEFAAKAAKQKEVDQIIAEIKYLFPKATEIAQETPSTTNKCSSWSWPEGVAAGIISDRLEPKTQK